MNKTKLVCIGLTIREFGHWHRKIFEQINNNCKMKLDISTVVCISYENNHKIVGNLYKILKVTIPALRNSNHKNMQIYSVRGNFNRTDHMRKEFERNQLAVPFMADLLWFDKDVTTYVRKGFVDVMYNILGFNDIGGCIVSNPSYHDGLRGYRSDFPNTVKNEIQKRKLSNLLKDLKKLNKKSSYINKFKSMLPNFMYKSNAKRFLEKLKKYKHNSNLNSAIFLKSMLMTENKQKQIENRLKLTSVGKQYLNIVDEKTPYFQKFVNLIHRIGTLQSLIPKASSDQKTKAAASVKTLIEFQKRFNNTSEKKSKINAASTLTNLEKINNINDVANYYSKRKLYLELENAFRKQNVSDIRLQLKQAILAIRRRPNSKSKTNRELINNIYEQHKNLAQEDF